MAAVGATVGTLRATLARYFPGVDLDAYFHSMTVSGLLPLSTAVTSRQAALVLIALSTGVGATEAPEEALRIATLELRSRSLWLPSGWITQPIELPEASALTLWVFTATQIEAMRGAIPGAHPLTFVVAHDEAAVQVPPEFGGGMLNFEPRHAEQRPVDENWRGIGGAIIEVVAELFEPIEPQKVDPALMAQCADSLSLKDFVTWH